MLKKCSKCKKIKSIDDFNWKNKDVKRSSHCRECSRSYIKAHYDNNKQYYLKKAAKRNLIIKNEVLDYLGNYLLSHPCVDCGEKDVLVLEFDHRLRENKKTNISYILRSRQSLQTLIDEINKCDVRYANCHRRKTEKENNSWKLKIRSSSSTG